MKSPHAKLGQLFHKLSRSQADTLCDLCDLESRSTGPKYELIRDLPIKNPQTELGDVESIIS